MFDKRMTTGEKIFNVLNCIILSIISFLCLFPFITLLSKSISEEAYVVSGQVTLLPKGFQLGAYKILLSSGDFTKAFSNTAFIAIVGTIIQVFFTACIAYAASKRDLPGRKLINLLYIFTMLFNGGIIPTFLVVKATGLMNNLFVLVVPGMVSTFNMILMRNYFEALPQSLEESAKIDGANNITVLFRIILPIALPSLCTIAIFSMVSIWNNYVGALIYLTKSDVRVLSVFLQNIISAAENKSVDNIEAMGDIASESFRAAAIFVSALPILTIYPFLQKYFVKGMTMGAVKQ